MLIPAPYYSAFDNDLRAFGEVVRVPVVLDPSNGWALTPQALDAAAAQAVARTGRPPRALLLTNPHNPLGRCVFSFARRTNGHTQKERKRKEELMIFSTFIHK